MNQLQFLLCLVVVYASSASALKCYKDALSTVASEITCNATAGEIACRVVIAKGKAKVYSCGAECPTYVDGMSTKCCSANTNLSNSNTMVCATSKITCYMANAGRLPSTCADDVTMCKIVNTNGTFVYDCAAPDGQGTRGCVPAEDKSTMTKTCCFEKSNSNNATCAMSAPTPKSTAAPTPKSPANVHIASIIVTVAMLFFAKVFV